MNSDLFELLIHSKEIKDLDLSPAVEDYLRSLQSTISKTGVDGLLHELDSLSGFDWEFEPVSPEVFFNDNGFLWDRHISRIHPVSRQHLIEMCDLRNPKSLIIDTGALGTGKSFRQAHWGVWLVYLISCLRDPSNYLGLGSGTDLVIGITATTKTTSADLAYNYVMDLIDNSPWFNRHFPRDRGVDARIDLPKKLTVLPESPATNPFIGKNLLAWLGDEVSFLEDTKTSRQERNLAENVGDIQSCAKRLFDKMHDRILNRFVGRKNFFGGIYICSSRQYPTDFMENLINRYNNNELSEEERKKYYVIEHAAWDLKDNIDKSKTFRVVVGDSQTGSFILSENEITPSDARVIEVPEAYRTAFDNNVEEAIRNQAGLSTITILPLIPKLSVIQRCIELGENLRIPLRHPCKKVITDLSDADGDFFDVEYLCVRGRDGRLQPRRDPDLPRFIHLDLSKGVGDPAGLSMVYAPYSIHASESFQTLDFLNVRPDLPFIVVELMLSIIPPKGGWMRFDRIRQIPLFLRDKLGFNVQWVTADQYQSIDLLQALGLQGFHVDDTVSMDRSPNAYLQLRSAMQEGRLAIYNYGTFVREIRKLRWDLKFKKVDHPVFDDESPSGRGSKDVSDCVAGAVSKLTKMFIEGKCGVDIIPHVTAPVEIVHEAIQQDRLMHRIFDDDKPTKKEDYEQLIDAILSVKSNY